MLTLTLTTLYAFDIPCTVCFCTQAAASVGVDDLADRLLHDASLLHINMSSKDLVAGMMRKLAAAGVSAATMARLFERERQLRGEW